MTIRGGLVQINVSVLASGSSGNSIYINDGKNSFLVDAGLSGKKIVNRLKKIDVHPDEIDGIFITHEHKDHIKGVGILSRRLDVPIYANDETWASCNEELGKLKEKNIKVFDKEFSFGDFDIRTIRISHDASAPVAYVVHRNNKKIVLATGFYGKPNMMNVPGEELPKVLHYYDDPHRYAWQNVLVVGGGNSAADAALETYRCNANVSVLVKHDTLKPSIKYWVKPDIDNRIKEGSITGYFNSEVLEIREKEVDIQTPDGKKTIPNDFVLAMTGYRPHFDLMKSMGIELTTDEKKMPVYDEKTLETNRKGLYVAGVVCGGMDTSSLFIENSRIHAEQIAGHIEKSI